MSTRRDARRRTLATTALVALLAGSSMNCSCPAVHRAERERRVEDFRESDARGAASRVELIRAFDGAEPFPSYLRPESGWSALPNNEAARRAEQLELLSDREVVAVERFLTREGRAWWVFFDAHGYVLDAHRED